MRGTILLIFLHFFIGSNAFELIPNSNTEPIDSTILIGKSKDFLRYARNEIFARHGYVFSDANLNIYFKHQDWYKPIDKNVKISDLEKANVNLIKKYEDQFEYSESEIVERINLNGYPIFYIAQDWDKLNFHWKTKKNYRFWTGYFHSLEKNNLWTLDCETIPPEAIMKLAINSLEISDEDPLRPNQINVIDFNANCQEKEEKEIKVDIYGPSSDPELYLLGFRDNKFQILFHKSGSLNNFICEAENVVGIDMTIRHDIAGTMFRKEIYYLDLDTGKVTVPFKELIEFSLYSATQQNVKYYKTKEAASNKDSNELVGEIAKGTALFFKKYYHVVSPGAIYFESENITGWFCYSSINYQNFSLSAAD